MLTSTHTRVLSAAFSGRPVKLVMWPEHEMDESDNEDTENEADDPDDTYTQNISEPDDWDTHSPTPSPRHDDDADRNTITLKLSYSALRMIVELAQQKHAELAERDEQMRNRRFKELLKRQEIQHQLKIRQQEEAKQQRAQEDEADRQWEASFFTQEPPSLPQHIKITTMHTKKEKIKAPPHPNSRRAKREHRENKLKHREQTKRIVKTQRAHDRLIKHDQQGDQTEANTISLHEHQKQEALNAQIQLEERRLCLIKQKHKLERLEIKRARDEARRANWCDGCKSERWDCECKYSRTSCANRWEHKCIHLNPDSDTCVQCGSLDHTAAFIREANVRMLIYATLENETAQDLAFHKLLRMNGWRCDNCTKFPNKCLCYDDPHVSFCRIGFADGRLLFQNANEEIGLKRRIKETYLEIVKCRDDMVNRREDEVLDEIQGNIEREAEEQEQEQEEKECESNIPDTWPLKNVKTAKPTKATTEKREKRPPKPGSRRAQRLQKEGRFKSRIQNSRKLKKQRQHDRRIKTDVSPLPHAESSQDDEHQHEARHRKIQSKKKDAALLDLVRKNIVYTTRL